MSKFLIFITLKQNGGKNKNRKITVQKWVQCTLPNTWLKSVWVRTSLLSISVLDFFSPEAVWDKHRAYVLWSHSKIVHYFSKCRAASYSPMKVTQWGQALGGGLHLWRGLSKCDGKCKNNCKHVIWGVLYNLYTVYWHFLDSICSTNVTSHGMKWRAVPGNHAIWLGQELSSQRTHRRSLSLNSGRELAFEYFRLLNPLH